MKTDLLDLWHRAYASAFAQITAEAASGGSDEELDRLSDMLVSDFFEVGRTDRISAQLRRREGLLATSRITCEMRRRRAR